VRTDEERSDQSSARTGIGGPMPNTMSVMSGSRRRWWWLALVLAMVAIVPGGAVADAPGGEAWFSSGIGTVTAATYPEATLHVGAIGGVETDRTYLRFDDVGGGDGVAAAVLTIPIAADAGTSAPEAAVVAACAVPGGLDGQPDTPPEVDCEGAPLATVTPDALTVDLTGLVEGDTVTVALVPIEGTWHVGFDSIEREGGRPADLAVTAPTPEATTGPPVAAPSTPVAPPPSSSSPTVALPPITVPPAASPGSAIAEQATPAPVAVAPATQVVSTDGGFDYPVVFALPLVLLVVIGVAGEGLTKPVRLRDERATS
jgi:hypothetical protein